MGLCVLDTSSYHLMVLKAVVKGLVGMKGPAFMQLIGKTDALHINCLTHVFDGKSFEYSS
jgi:hypothetical protein